MGQRLLTMAYTMDLFLKLDDDQEREFRQWARDNYVPLEPISGVWHPVIQDECSKINSEYKLQ